MQRYRINYRWLIGVFASSFVLAVVAFFVQRWQVERKAGVYITNAEEFLAEDNLLEAFESFNKYVQLRPEEDEARIKMATVAVDVIKDPMVTFEVRSQALGLLDQAVRTTNDTKLRRKLAEIMLLFRRSQDAIGHLEDLLATSPKDPELNAMHISALFQAKEFKKVKTLAFDLIGYDRKTDTFETEKSSVSVEPDVYALLSDVLVNVDRDGDLARRIIDQMVLVNPDSAQANLQKSIFLVRQKDPETAKYLKRAYELDPKDATILTRKGMVALYGLLYKESKAAYQEAMTGYEETVAQFGSQDSVEEGNSPYDEVKASYEKAISGLEASQPNYKEAKAEYVDAKSKYEAAVSQIAPKNADDLNDPDTESLEAFNLAKANFEWAMPNIEEAKDLFAQGLKEHPDNVQFYKLMAEAESRLEQYDAALKVLDVGIARFEKIQNTSLVLAKLNIFFATKDYPGVDREIKRLKQMHRPDLQPVIDFQHARKLFSEQNWVDAATELKRIRPLLLNNTYYQKMAGTMLGACYEQQGVFEIAREVYELVTNEYPEHLPAQHGLARMNARIHPQKRAGAELDRIVNEMLEAPEANQDWDQVSQIVDKIVASRKISEAGQFLLRSKILIKRGKIAEAKSLIRKANKTATSEEELDIRFAAVMLVLSDPEQGAASALKLLNQLEEKFGSSLRSIVQRANLLAILNPEDVSEQLRSLITTASELPETEQAQIGRFVGSKFDQLGKYDDAREFFEKAAQREPNNLPLRIHLFELALRQRSDAEMQKAQEAILEIVKSKENPSYILTELKRRITLYNQGEITKSELANCRDLLDTALRQRPEWHEMHIAYGQFLLNMGGEMDLALRHFDKALDYGPARSSAVAVQVKLLADRGLYSQARKRMDLLSKKNRGQFLGQLEADILIKTGDAEKGFRIAEKLAESQANNPKTLLWFSRIAQQAGKLDAAVDSLNSALEINPAAPDNWMRLIGLYAKQEKFDLVFDVIRKAHLSSDAEFLPLLTAKYHEITSRWRDAESLYLAAYADQLDVPSVNRRLAEFYLLWAKKDKAYIGKSAKYVNKILKAANDGEIATDNQHAIWARQKAAKLLLSDNDYQQSLRAERLLRQGAANGSMGIEEGQLLVDILIARGDPQSLLQAIELLTQLHSSGQLPQKGALQLARLLSQANHWNRSRDLLLELIAKYPSDPQVRATYISLLIDQTEYASAERSLKRLKTMDPKNSSLVQLSARLASERGDQVGLNRLLTSLLPKLKGAMNESQLKQVLSIAQFATLYGDQELAEKLYRFSVKRSPDQLYQLAKFLAYHGNCDEALSYMKRLFTSETDRVVQLASQMVNVRRDEVGDKYDEQVDRMIDAALREDPDSVSRKLARAETYEIQGKNEKSVEAYEQLLSRDDLPVRVRAAAMNNLGFQLALMNQRVDEAEQLVNNAMKTFGPVEDMLDTRAVVHMAQKKYDLAIKDMVLALSVSRDPVKYFHLAKAYILAGDGQAASTAWKKAKNLGFEKDALPRLEKADFEQILEKIENFQTQNAKL